VSMKDYHGFVPFQCFSCRDSAFIFWINGINGNIIRLMSIDELAS
jgi:hypothetical protein